MNLILLEQMTCFGKTEFSVTLVTALTGSGSYVEGVEKTLLFATEEESTACFEKLRPISNYTPYVALKHFNRYGKSAPKMHMSSCMGPKKIVRH